MKAIILLVLGALFAGIGLGAVDTVFVSLPALILATTTITEAINTWLNFHKWNARLATALTAIALTFLGWGLNLGYLSGLELTQVILEAFKIIIYAFGVWSGLNFKGLINYASSDS